MSTCDPREGGAGAELGRSRALLADEIVLEGSPVASFHRPSCPTRGMARPGCAAEEKWGQHPGVLPLLPSQAGSHGLPWVAIRSPSDFVQKFFSCSNPFIPYQLYSYAGYSGSPGIPALARLGQEDCCEF